MSDASAEKEPPEEEAKLETIAKDARFQNTNQTYRCFTNFLDYHRCIQLLGDGYEPCDTFKKVYTVMCPNFWISKWEEQLEQGTFPGRLPSDEC